MALRQAREVQLNLERAEARPWHARMLSDYGAPATAMGHMSCSRKPSRSTAAPACPSTSE